MSDLRLYGREINSVFQLLGYKENDISYSIAWVLAKCKSMLEAFVVDVCSVSSFNLDDVTVNIQEYDKESGITDIEILDGKEFYIIVEAKRGWDLPGKKQLTMYGNRDTFTKSKARNKVILTLSECSKAYADSYLPIKSINGVPIKHLSWKDIYSIADIAYGSASNTEKKLIRELQVYLRGLVTMQNQNSNEVFVVSLGKDKPEGCKLTWIDIVKQKERYFHPMGNNWPKEPPNYIAFRYGGKLQSIHHIESYIVSTNMSDEIPEMPDQQWDVPHFLYRLGPAIIPPKEIRTGKIYKNGRVKCYLDTLFTCSTISDARDLTKKRMETS